VCGAVVESHLSAPMSQVILKLQYERIDFITEMVEITKL
jgi:hypothetical protein